jgi:hypothetical protein
LFREIPLPDPKPAHDVAQIGDNFVLTRELKTDIQLPAVGRPPLKWDDFHVEIAKRVQRGELPSKQEAYISEMQAWCVSRWGQEVGRSTLLQKIKPYYDSFVRSKKSENKP